MEFDVSIQKEYIFSSFLSCSPEVFDFEFISFVYFTFFGGLNVYFTWINLVWSLS